MAQADVFRYTPHSENLSRILRHALRLAALAGEEQDAVRTDALRRVHGLLASSTALAPMAQPYIEGLIMNMTMETMWPLWAIVVLLAIVCRHETIITSSGLSWGHRILGTVAALAFFAGHLWLLKCEINLSSKRPLWR
jgi:hypothetical protein